MRLEHPRCVEIVGVFKDQRNLEELVADGRGPIVQEDLCRDGLESRVAARRALAARRRRVRPLSKRRCFHMHG
jgi:hypothetical protein